MIQLTLLLFCFLMTVPTTFADGHLNHSAHLKSKEDDFKRANNEYKAAYARVQEAQSSLDTTLHNLKEANDEFKRALFHSMTESIGSKTSESN